MKLFKKSLAVLLVAFMVLTSAPLAGFVGFEIELPEWPTFEAKAADEYLTSGFCGDTSAGGDGKNISWTLNSRGVLTVTGTGKIAPEAFSGDLRIKEVIISDGITNVSDYCFQSCSQIVKITMGNSVKSIGTRAFYSCKALKTITLSDTLETIGNEGFYYCMALTSISLPSSLETIGAWCFEYCTVLKNLILPEGLITIGYSAFFKCFGLEKITIPDSTTTVGDNAFEFCSNIKTIYIGAGVTKFPINALSGCDGLCSITVSEDNKTFSSFDGVLYNKQKTKLIKVPAVKSGVMTIPSTVEELTTASVGACTKITEFIVEEGNQNYKSIDGIIYTADGKRVVVCPKAKTGDVVIPVGVEVIGASAFSSCTGLTSIELPETVEIIEKSAFYGCDIFTNLIFPKSLKFLAGYAFYNCYGIKTVVFPESLESIEGFAFGSCKGLTSITLPSSLTVLDGYAFYKCTGLETVHIGAGLTDLNVNAFINCDNLSSITVSDSNEAYSSYGGVVYNKEKTKVITAPCAISGEVIILSTVDELTFSSFDGCKKITALNVEPGNVNYKSVDGIVYSADGKELIICPRGKAGNAYIAVGTEVICKSAFARCENLTDITFPETVRIIKDSAFLGCKGLTSLILPEPLTTIERYGVSYCTAIKSITLPESLTTIGDYAFAYNHALQSINIPEKITKIKYGALASCGLTEMTLHENLQFFEDHSWSKLKTLTICNRYGKYTGNYSLSFPKDCVIRAYCGSPGHELAVKQLYNFESIGHTYLDWYVVQPATYEAYGIERRDCAYCDGYEERAVTNLVDNVFTATFVADGKTVATVDFPKGTTEIAEPAVPAKNRYMGEWEDYTLADADITINAVYTLIKSDDASEIETESEAIHYTDKDDVLFRFKAWADATVVKSTVSKAVPLDIVLVVDQSGSMDETLGGKTKKVDALKETAKDFVNTVFENAKMTDADHRISLVGFGLSGNYQGFEKNENTELLTSANGIVKFDNIKTTDYASSLVSVNVGGEVNDKLITAINSIGARGATAADLGFEMAKGVFANTDSTGRQRVVIFMTDGEPTYMSGFQTSVANSAIANASVLKKNFGASIYSVGVFSDSDSRNTNINKFMNAISSGYPDAVSMNYMGTGVDGQYYLTVNNTDSLTSVFKSISTESLSHTAPFDNLTVIKTLSEYVTLTSKQEEQLRIDLIRKYGITNDDIIITRNDDGTTTIQINSLTPYEVTDEEGNITYEVAVEFFASLNEKANTAGDYIVDTEDSGVMLGEDAKGYEATFGTSAITLDADKVRVIFTINGKAYEVSENLNNGYAVAPEFEIAEDWQFSGWDTSAKATNGTILDATLTKAERTVTWHTAEGDIIQTYVEGDFIKAPVVEYNADGDTFLSWDKSIPTTMPDENLEFTAVYGGHVHKYTSEVTKEMTCTADGVRTYTCSCGDTYGEVITAVGHNYEAITPSLEKDDAKCTFCCTNCGDKYDYALDYVVVQSTGKKDRVLYEFQLTDDNLNTEMQPDGAIQIKIPLSELHGSAEHVTVIRTNDDGSKTRVPAVHEKGFLIITCDHFTPYEVIFAIPCEGHIQGEWIIEKEATCTEEGYKCIRCTECEMVIEEEILPIVSHSESDWIVDKEATCTAEGSQHKICTVCKVTLKTEAIRNLSHSYSETITAPTCTQEGYTTCTCACGDSYVADKVDALGHAEVSHEAKAPTCKAIGWEAYVTCSKCDYTTCKEIAATGHHDNNSDNVCDSCQIQLKTDDCSCNCHKSGFMKFIWKILCFFYKIFKTNKVCTCGVAHY